MKTRWIEENEKYDGSQLRSLFGYLTHGVLGDVALSWRGACDVALEHMVDGEDKLANAAIRGDDMLHFIVERFGEGLSFSVALQRLVSAMAKDLVVEMSPQKDKTLELTREGDDIFWKDKKMSISIATVSPVSSLIHFAVNVTNDGTPVETCSLSDFEIEPEVFAQELLSRIRSEVETVVEGDSEGALGEVANFKPSAHNETLGLVSVCGLPRRWT